MYWVRKTLFGHTEWFCVLAASEFAAIATVQSYLDAHAEWVARASRMSTNENAPLSYRPIPLGVEVG